MRWRYILTVWGKELREALRDRRTLVTTLVIPTVVVPTLILAMGFFARKVVTKAKEEVSTVMVLNAESAPALVRQLKASTKLELRPVADDWKRQISDKKLRAVLEIPEHFERRAEAGELASLKIYDYDGELRSRFASDELKRVAIEYRDGLVKRSLEARGLSTAVLKPFDISTENVAEPEKVGGNALGGVIPYVFILFCFSGCMYPAMDLTAGEKERGTLETLLCSPATRAELVMGKFLTVLTTGLTTVVCSLLSLAVSMTVLAQQVLGEGGTQAAGASASKAMPLASFDPMGLPMIVLLSLPLAACFAALLLGIGIKARSMKEAQSLMTPLVMVIILPAMMAMLPGMELNARLALVPILNLALASKEVLSGVWHWSYLLMILASLCVYAAAALWFCARQFGREELVFRQ